MGAAAGSWRVLLAAAVGVPLLVLCALLFGEAVVPTASHVVGFAFAFVPALGVCVVCRIAGRGSRRVGWTVYAAFTLGTIAGGHWVHYGLASGGARTVSGVLDHLAARSDEGVAHRERLGPGTRARATVVRRGAWAWWGWSLQALWIVAGNLVGMVLGLGSLLERRRPGAPGALAPVSDYLAAVGQILDGPPLAPEETAALLAATADAYRRRHGRDRVPGEPVDTDSLFLQAAAVLGRHDPTLSEYGARQRVVAEFNRRRPRPHPVLLSPEPRFDTRGLEQAPPAVGPRFEHWLTGAVRHWEDITYIALSNTPPDEVPEGAFLPLLVQWLHLGDHRLREGWNGTPIETVLERLGVRLHPAVVEYLRRPERYDPDADPTILSGLFGLVRDWPEPVARPLFRRALEIGWNLAARHLPATPWARLLVQEFAASPYGAPPLARV